MTEFDPVNNPRHYTEGRQHEPIDVIEDWGLDFQLGNAVKYISRAGRKGNAVQDLRKAIWYIEREISKLEKEQEAKSHVASVWGGVVLNPNDPPAAVPVPNNETATVVDTNGTVEINPPLDEPDIFTAETRLRDIA